MTESTLSEEPLAVLTRQYARFSLTAGGLGSVIGGGLAIVSYFVGALAPPDVLWGRVGLALTPVVWIAAKEWLRLHYYQQFGRVEQVRSRSELRWHLGFTLFTAVVSVFVLGVVAAGLVQGGRSIPDAPGMIGYVAFVAAMPVLVWRYMRTPLEFIVGVFLVAQAALALVGAHYGLGEQPQAPLAGLALIVIGAKQHREFGVLRRKLSRMGPA